MNIHKKDNFDGSTTIGEELSKAHLELFRDIVGWWSVVSSGREAYSLSGKELREYVFLYVFTLVAHGAIVIDNANDGKHYWAAVNRYGTSPEEVAHNVTAEWIDRGEPDPPAWDSLAFCLPGYLDSPINLRTSDTD